MQSSPNLAILDALEVERVLNSVYTDINNHSYTNLNDQEYNINGNNNDCSYECPILYHINNDFLDLTDENEKSIDITKYIPSDNSHIDYNDSDELYSSPLEFIPNEYLYTSASDNYNSSEFEYNSAYDSSPCSSDQFNLNDSIETFKLNDMSVVSNANRKIRVIRSGRVKDRVRKLSKKPANMKDCLHVWEFLRDLLKENKNEMVQWLDAKKGIFKIVDPDQVSDEWGYKKCNKRNMKYPNMARGIRYSREEGGYFDPVTKADGFGKKLVYKFSKKTLNYCEWLREIIEN